MRMSETCGNNNNNNNKNKNNNDKHKHKHKHNNSDNSLASHRTDGGKNRPPAGITRFVRLKTVLSMDGSEQFSDLSAREIGTRDSCLIFLRIAANTNCPECHGLLR